MHFAHEIHIKALFDTDDCLPDMLPHFTHGSIICNNGENCQTFAESDCTMMMSSLCLGRSVLLVYHCSRYCLLNKQQWQNKHLIISQTLPYVHTDTAGFPRIAVYLLIQNQYTENNVSALPHPLA